MTTIITPPGQTTGPEHDDGRPPAGPGGLREAPVTGNPRVDLDGSLPGRERAEHRSEVRAAPGPPSSRQPKRPLGLATTFVAASVAVLGGLLAWTAFDSFSSTSGSTRSWETVPSGQPYYVAPGTPAVPKTGAGAAAPMAGMSMGQKASTGTTTASAASSTKLPPMVDSTPSAVVTLKIDPPPLGGTYGSDGQVHDDFSPAYFSVPAGKTAHVTVYNYDDMWHTFTSPVLGLNVWIRPGGDHPSTTTFTFTAPKTGYYWWLCAIPCDSYSMSTGGFMQGEIHAVKA